VSLALCSWGHVTQHVLCWVDSWLEPGSLQLGTCYSSHHLLVHVQVTNNPENDGCINAVLLV